MTLIRGLTGLSPCPVCLVPIDKQADLSLTFELRTKEKVINLFNEVQNKKAVDRNEKLKAQGLRYVKVRYVN